MSDKALKAALTQTSMFKNNNKTNSSKIIKQLISTGGELKSETRRYFNFAEID